MVSCCVVHKQINNNTKQQQKNKDVNALRGAASIIRKKLREKSNLDEQQGKMLCRYQKILFISPQPTKKITIN